MPYVSELLIKNDEPLMLARIKADGTIVNGGENGYQCIAIKGLTQTAMDSFGTTADSLRAAFPKSDPKSAVEHLRCPILDAMPKHPYTAPDGYTYEKACWDRWAKECRSRPDGVTSPMTNEPMKGPLRKNEYVAQIIKDVADKIIAAGGEVEIGTGERTLEDIWAEFYRRQCDRLAALQQMVSLTAIHGAAAVINTTKTQPVQGSTLGSTAGTGTSSVVTSIATLPLEAAADGAEATVESTSVVTARNLSCS